MNLHDKATKRNILASVAQIYDPLGVLGPIVLQVKIFIQQLWLLKCGWDEEITTEIKEKWIHWKTQIYKLKQLSIPRRILCDNPARIEIHGFCDASESAYDACIYLRTKEINANTKYMVKLLCAKSRVAPVKKVSLPRLELCGALLLAKLSKRVLQMLTVHIDEVYLWSDSTIVLSWIARDSTEWKTFVANRVGEIQRKTKGTKWYHVKSEDNPADLLSRGVNPERLIDKGIWWEGPQFLQRCTTFTPFSNKGRQAEMIERRTTVLMCLRFKDKHSTQEAKSLTVEEIERSMKVLISGCQRHSFTQELHDLRKEAIRSVLRHCIICFRAKPVTAKQLMGNMPAIRVTQSSRAFLYSGVDYAVTRAVHFELVPDLNTTSFLNALKRFIARRGRCKVLYLHNGTTFVGANNQLKELKDCLLKEATQSQIQEYLTEQSIDWKFIPPYSPHIGGLWEAGVKSAKTHMRKVIGPTPMSFEELYTVLTSIEACLNSRPLTPLSNDPTDLQPLTPGHFLRGEVMTAIPDQDIANVPANHLTRYQLLTQMRQHFWARWSKEYITQLQERGKWKQSSPVNIHPGTMVILKNENAPPMAWPLGRVVEIHPGADGLTRIVTVKISRGLCRSALVKLKRAESDIDASFDSKEGSAKVSGSGGEYSKEELGNSIVWFDELSERITDEESEKGGDDGGESSDISMTEGERAAGQVVAQLWLLFGEWSLLGIDSNSFQNLIRTPDM
ncbi:uncharacterized protein [Anoplolepis gracilipes]|uniref:uncharacterized protein n=1 Tax=Anoplolepis gracilipes TaxID=354296 RepID=UPI003B9F952D